MTLQVGTLQETVTVRGGGIPTKRLRTTVIGAVHANGAGVRHDGAGRQLKPPMKVQRRPAALQAGVGRRTTSKASILMQAVIGVDGKVQERRSGVAGERGLGG